MDELRAAYLGGECSGWEEESVSFVFGAFGVDLQPGTLRLVA